MGVDSFDTTRFRFIAGHPSLLFGETKQGGWCLAIWFGCSVLNWDHGLVNCGTNILHRCWLFWQNKMQDNCWMSFIIIVGNNNRGKGLCFAIWFDCSASNWDCGHVKCGTNIPCKSWLFWPARIRSCCFLDIFCFKIWLLPLLSPIHYRSSANFPLLSCPLGQAIFWFESNSQSKLDNATFYHQFPAVPFFHLSKPATPFLHFPSPPLGHVSLTKWESTLGTWTP